MILAYAVCAVPVAPIRAEASHRSEQTSQLIFGEKVEVMCQEPNGWLYISCEWDGYVGWVKEGQVAQIELKDFRKPYKFLSGSITDSICTLEARTLLSPGSSLFIMNKSKFSWLCDENKFFRGKKVSLSKLNTNYKDIEGFAKMFMGAPYLWGGRNIMGIDCSGFSQIVYKLMNMKLPRDAYQQANKGENVAFLQEARCGDLAFFDNEDGKITHVGILLNNSTIIHATEVAGGVVIDKIDNGGIISQTKKTRTHNLRLIKRYILD